MLVFGSVIGVSGLDSVTVKLLASVGLGMSQSRSQSVRGEVSQPGEVGDLLSSIRSDLMLSVTSESGDGFGETLIRKLEAEARLAGEDDRIISVWVRDDGSDYEIVECTYRNIPDSRVEDDDIVFQLPVSMVEDEEYREMFRELVMEIEREAGDNLPF